MTYKLQAVGTDAETFLRDKKGKPFPVCGLLGGTKEEPKPVLGRAGFAIQEDNVMPEFNVPAALTEDQFVTDIGTMLSWLSDTVADKGLKVAIESSMLFTPTQLLHPQAQRFGCEPDYCVWTRRANSSPAETKESKTLRTASAHIHVGFTKNGKTVDEIFATEPRVKALEITIGLPSVILDPAGSKRRKMYGKAGAFRPKPYGIEYRVASNFWIATPALRRWVYRGVQRAVTLANQERGSYLNGVCKNYGHVIAETINNGDTGAAVSLLDTFSMTERYMTPQ